MLAVAREMHRKNTNFDRANRFAMLTRKSLKIDDIWQFCKQ
jgi:hypothetical protein